MCVSSPICLTNIDKEKYGEKTSTYITDSLLWK